MTDPDRDPLTQVIGAADPAVADASFDTQSGDIVLRPLRRGRSVVTLSISNGQAKTSGSFTFGVADVTKAAAVDAAADGSQEITLANAGEKTVELVLTRNGLRTFESVPGIGRSRAS